MDDTTWPLYLATSRSDTTTFTELFAGFMFEMHIYQEEYSVVATHYAASGCAGASPCPNNTVWTDGFAEYNGDATVCESPSCDYLGCKRSGTDFTGSECVDCTAVSGGTKWCNMCYDRECKDCS